MANSSSSRKRARQNPKRRNRNKMLRSRLRTFTNAFFEAVETGDVAQAEDAFRSVQAQLQRAASKGIIPRARASRRTSRLASQLDQLRQA